MQSTPSHEFLHKDLGIGGAHLIKGGPQLSLRIALLGQQPVNGGLDHTGQAHLLQCRLKFGLTVAGEAGKLRGIQAKLPQFPLITDLILSEDAGLIIVGGEYPMALQIPRQFNGYDRPVPRMISDTPNARIR